MTYYRKKPAIGSCRTAAGMRKVVCTLDPDTFAEIRKRAVAEKTSFAEQVRMLIEWGLLAEREAA